jgi:hypothetical protein
LETNAQIGADVIGSGWEVYADDVCWPAEMAGVHQVNVADLLDRGALMGQAFDASNGLPLNGAQVQAYLTVAGKQVLRGAGVITPYVYGPFPWEEDPSRVYMWFTQTTDILNLPAGGDYVAKLHMSGYTASPQPAFQHNDGMAWDNEIHAGSWQGVYRGSAPPRSSNFDAVVHWWRYIGYDNDADFWDLDTNVWLPVAPNSLDPSQPAPFIIGPEGDAFGYLEGEPYGTLNAFPFGLWKRDGGWVDWVPIEDVTIRSRLAHAPLSANAGLPYYPGEYVIMVTDWGQEIDHDGLPGTPEIPLMGSYSQPQLYVWKDGVIKLYLDMGYQEPGEPCNAHWWKAASIRSGLSGAPVYTPINTCDLSAPGFFPYFAIEEGGLLQITKE